MALQKKKLIPPGLNYDLIGKHAFGWLLFMVYEITFVWSTTGALFRLESYVCYYSLNILLFYCNAHLLLNYAFRKRLPYLVAIPLLAAELLLYVSVKYGVDYLLERRHALVISQFMNFRKFLIIDVYRGIYFMAFSSLYWSVLRMLEYRRRTNASEEKRLRALMANTELEKDLAEASNAYLRHQINPHFLFNVLSFIHNVVYKMSKTAANCVMLLTDITHYSFEDTGKDGKTELSKEIKQVKNLIALNRLRYSHPLYLDFKIKGRIGNARIIPLILITLIENMFKHGNLMDKKYPGRVFITVNRENSFNLTCWNLKNELTKRKRIKTIGIENVFKRLEYTYKDHYKLNITEDEVSYGLNLNIQL